MEYYTQGRSGGTPLDVVLLKHDGSSGKSSGSFRGNLTATCLGVDVAGGTALDVRVVPLH